MKVAATVAMMLLLSACGGSAGPRASATTSPSAVASPSSAAAPTPTAGPTGMPGGATHVRCSTPVPAGDNLVIGTVTGDPTVVVRDIQDPAHARNLCSFDADVFSPQFISASEVAYATSTGQLVRANLATGDTTLIAAPGAGFGADMYSVSPDGRSVTYLVNGAWHLVTGSGDRVLTTLPPVPGRGVSPDQDDSYLSFSPDGRYVALVQTFAVGGSGETAPDQVRRASDGALVFSTAGMTMGVWASVPSRLFFRDQAGSMRRWDPATGMTTMLSVQWIRPRSSPDGRWTAFTFRTKGGLGSISLYGVQSNTVTNVSAAGRSGVRFLTNDLIWYAGEKACTACFGGFPTPTGTTYIYSIAGRSEVVSRLSGVFDAWPRATAP